MRSNSLIVVNWEAGSEDGGDPEGYYFKVSVNGQLYQSSSSTEYRHKGKFKAGEIYKFKVEASNSFATSEAREVVIKIV